MPAPSTTPAPTTPNTGNATGTQLWATYVAANKLVDELNADPRGLSTDPRLRQFATGQWLSEVAQGINTLRLRGETIKGPDRLYGFTLLRIAGNTGTFDACDGNSQETFNFKSGAQLTNTGYGTQDLQVTEINVSGRWLIDQVALNKGVACSPS